MSDRWRQHQGGGFPRGGGGSYHPRGSGPPHGQAAPRTPPPLPADLGELLRARDVSNLGLFFNKYIDAWKEGSWELGEEKRKFLEKILGSRPADRYRGILDGQMSRRRALLESLRESGSFVDSFEKITEARLIMGLGAGHVLETGMMLHPLYGYPYMPGSGLKGLARAYAELVAGASPQELLAIFGSEDKQSENNRRGYVDFLDAIPAQFPRLEIDIMNPHFGEYYQKKDIPPADYLSPNPIVFLAVGAGVKFNFGIVSQDEDALRKARRWLEGGLVELGAGGKTNAGYGYFR